MKRKIVKIDAGKCNGCGLCVGACAEAAIALVDGKAKLVSDMYCDGLGACLGECPQGAIAIEERDAGSFDESAVQKRLAETRTEEKESPGQGIHHSGGCPGSKVMEIKRDKSCQCAGETADFAESELTQWPVQLHLVSVKAPYWDGADILVCADCVAFAAGNFQTSFLKDRKIAIACPKLDDTSGYVEKLAAIFRENEIRSVTVARMEVPCCMGLVHLAKQAIAASGKDVPLNEIIVSVKGEVESGVC